MKTYAVKRWFPRIRYPSEITDLFNFICFKKCFLFKKKNCASFENSNMTDDSHARDYLDGAVRNTIPPDQINRLSYCLHPDGYINPYETPVALTEYQLK